ncbi:MAG: DUF2188 domain-containing protein [Patescibacteria group bacterium]|nr:DUF2188 domain-containing protein [Patescibacteria group bacterium]MDD4304524.1 DUF2188 domain-containing protein [Patescibacteria group bacterium]MDD4694884.1 DUF2188 domain-containing protein [Patescibacteria group bacterium]
MSKNIHVTHRINGDWAVIGEGDKKASSLHSTQKDALSIARELAQNNKSELVIHGKDNKIIDKDSYGNDPCPPKDRKK